MSDNDSKYPRNSVAALDIGQLNMMWQFLQLGALKRNPDDVRVLKQHLDYVRQAMIQKSAGQRKGDPSYYVNWDDLGTIVNIIVCSAMSLYLSGGLDKLEKLLSEEKESRP